MLCFIFQAEDYSITMQRRDLGDHTVEIQHTRSGTQGLTPHSSESSSSLSTNDGTERYLVVRKRLDASNISLQAKSGVEVESTEMALAFPLVKPQAVAARVSDRGRGEERRRGEVGFQKGLLQLVMDLVCPQRRGYLEVPIHCCRNITYVGLFIFHKCNTMLILLDRVCDISIVSASRLCNYVLHPCLLFAVDVCGEAASVCLPAPPQLRLPLHCAR